MKDCRVAESSGSGSRACSLIWFSAHHAPPKVAAVVKTEIAKAADPADKTVISAIKAADGIR